MTTERRFLHSTMAAYGSQLGRTVLRLTTDLLLARLILPEGHGLFALAWPIVVIAGFVRDLGLPYEVVRHRRQPYGSFLIWEAGAGAAVTALLVAVAPLFAGLRADLPDVLRVLSLFVLIEAFAVVPRTFFERELAVRRVVLPEIGRSAIMAATSIGLAAAGHGVWSFVFGELTAALFYALALWRLAYGKIPLRFDGVRIPALLRHSSLLFLIALLGNATPFVGRYIVERVDTVAMVGQFEKALLWALRTQILLVPAMVRALYPALVAYRSLRDRFIGAYHLGTVAILSVEVLVAYFVFFNAEIVILEILLGERWEPAVGLIRILCLLPLVDPFTRLGGELLKVRREDRVWLLIVLLNIACLAGFGWLLSRELGAPGMAWAHYLLLGNLLMAWRVWRICGPGFWPLVADLARVYLVPLPFFVAAALLFPAASWSRFAASAAAAALAGSILLARFAPPFRRFFFGGAGGGSVDSSP